MRHHPILRTTTALTLSLSIVNGGAASARMPGSLQGSPDAATGQARILLAQAETDCSADPAAAGCAAPVAPPADGSAASAEPAEPPSADGSAASPETVVPPADPAATAAEPAEPAAEPQAAPSPTDATTDAAPADPTGEAGQTAPEPAPTVAEPLAEPAATPQTASQAEAAAPETGTEPAPQAATAEEPAKPAGAATQAQPAPEADETAPEAPPAAEPAADQGTASSASGQAGEDAVATAPAVQPAPAETAPAETTRTEAAPPPTAEQQAVLDSLMAKPEVASAVQTLEQAIAPTAETAAPVAAAAALEGVAPPPAATSTQTITAETARSSAQDFQTKVTTAAPTTAEKKSGLSDLEKAGLVALGAVAVGMMVANSRVVANSGDRVVVDQGNGNLAVWKDDDALLRQPGVVETTQRYSDGSTLSSIARGDGSTVETVRDATGRVLRREIVFPNGQRVGIIDDTRPVRPVDVSRLPKPRVTSLSLVDEADIADLRNRLAAAEQPGLPR